MAGLLSQIWSAVYGAQRAARTAERQSSSTPRSGGRGRADLRNALAL